MEDIEVPPARMIDAAKSATRPRKAAALVEYALILSLVSLLVIGSLALVGGQVNVVFASLAGTLGGQQNGGCQGAACAGNNGNGQGDENGNPGGGNPGGDQGGGPGNGGGNGNSGGNGSGK